MRRSGRKPTQGLLWDHPAAELLLETLLARPGFDRRAIDYEMFVGQKVLSLGMRQGQH